MYPIPQGIIITAEVIEMQGKQIVFTRPNVAELLSYEITPPKAGYVQVALEISTVSSGTERANVSGDVNVSTLKREEKAVFPRYAGYSSAGRVLAVGENVKSLKPGDRVAMFWSTHSQILNIAESRCMKLPDSVSAQEAALFHIVTFPLAAIRKCRLEMGESALVMGQGILGLLAVKLLRIAGALPIIAADPIPEKRQRALEAGADHALDPFAPDFAETVKRLTGGGVKAAIEVTGKGQALDTTLDCMAPLGRVALLGCTRDSNFTIDYYRKVHGPGITLVGAHTNARPGLESAPGYWTQQDDFACVLALTAGGRLKLKDMVEETHSPEEAPAVYTRLVSEPSFPVVQFDWRLLK